MYIIIITKLPYIIIVKIPLLNQKSKRRAKKRLFSFNKKKKKKKKRKSNASFLLSRLVFEVFEVFPKFCELYNNLCNKIN